MFLQINTYHSFIYWLRTGDEVSKAFKKSLSFYIKVMGIIFEYKHNFTPFGNLVEKYVSVYISFSYIQKNKYLTFYSNHKNVVKNDVIKQLNAITKCIL